MHAITDQQISKSKSELTELESRHRHLLDEFETLSAELKSTLGPKQVMDLHIKRLKEYNELRDDGIRLAQLIADQKSCKIRDVFEEMGFSMSDE